MEKMEEKELRNLTETEHQEYVDALVQLDWLNLEAEHLYEKFHKTFPNQSGIMDKMVTTSTAYKTLNDKAAYLESKISYFEKLDSERLSQALAQNDKEIFERE